eukprot:2406992-Pyramimonas_sp.AAC.1
MGAHAHLQPEGAPLPPTPTQTHIHTTHNTHTHTLPGSSGLARSDGKSQCNYYARGRGCALRDHCGPRSAQHRHTTQTGVDGREVTRQPRAQKHTFRCTMTHAH